MTDQEISSRRAAILERHGAAGSVLEELLAYNANVFQPSQFNSLPQLPVADEMHVESWLGYSQDAEKLGTIPALSKRLVQLLFPIQEGISQTDDYRAATRRGVFPLPGEAPRLSLKDPDGVQLVIHPTMAGRVPMLIARERDDFESLVRVFSERNEPAAVPPSMGACIVTGLNNWDRIHTYRRSWVRANPTAEESDWSKEFQKLVPLKHLYQDRFIILSSGPYSGVSAGMAGIPETEWLEMSMRIRREHEATHYFTWRLLGSMRNNLIDEIIADYAGLVSVFGRFRADLALLFFGLENYPDYRTGGRLENYRGNPPLSQDALRLVMGLTVEAIRNLEKFNLSLPEEERRDPMHLAQTVVALAAMTLEELTADDIAENLHAMLGRQNESRLRRESVHEESIQVENSSDGLAELMERFETFALDHEIPVKVLSSLNLALDELVSNIIKYGYDDEERHTITLEVRLTGGRLDLEIVDDGHEFNVLEQEDPDVSLGIEERKIGGLGIFIVKQLMDEMHYERRNDQNHLFMSKNLD
ncbi:MAG: ATP-binding protein [Thermoanaerobaculia bacterium]